MTKLLSALFAALLCLGVLAAPSAADPPGNGLDSTEGVFDFGVGDGTGGMTELTHDRNAITMDADITGLEPGHAYTLWLIIFNNPAACVDGCGEDDLFRNGVLASGIFSGIGGFADGDGNLSGYKMTAEGYDNGTTLFGPGLKSAKQAEVHVIVRSHGPESGDAAVSALQISTVDGGCDGADVEDVPPDALGECGDVGASVHLSYKTK